MTFTFPRMLQDGTMSACVVTNGAGSDEEARLGGQAWLARHPVPRVPPPDADGTS